MNTAALSAPDGFQYFADFLNDAAQVELLARVKQLDFTHDSFRGQTLKRGYAQFGFAYVSTGRKTVPAPAWPEFLTTLATAARTHCPDCVQFNQCIVTHYPAGAGI